MNQTSALEATTHASSSPTTLEPSPQIHLSDQGSGPQPAQDLGPQLEYYARELGTTYQTLIERSTMLEQSQRAIIAAFTASIEARDPYTQGHTQRVTSYALSLARELGWQNTKLEQVQLGCELHDVGKIAVPDRILQKTERLTDEEFGIIRTHPEVGAKMIREIPYLKAAIPYVLHHHERWDGFGYPHQLAAESIPMEGRLTAVADAFDAMTSDRPYRKGLSLETAKLEIETGIGKQFDPKMARAFLRGLENKRILFIPTV
jgi:putative nucleotidyltransferase with HDIG domain